MLRRQDLTSPSRQDKNAGNSGDLVKHTVYLAMLNHLARNGRKAHIVEAHGGNPPLRRADRLTDSYVGGPHAADLSYGWQDRSAPSARSRSPVNARKRSAGFVAIEPPIVGSDELLCQRAGNFAAPSRVRRKNGRKLSI